MQCWVSGQRKDFKEATVRIAVTHSRNLRQNLPGDLTENLSSVLELSRPSKPDNRSSFTIGEISVVMCERIHTVNTVEVKVTAKFRFRVYVRFGGKGFVRTQIYPMLGFWTE